MKLETHLSPNFQKKLLDVRFCILHYSALDLQATINHFMNEEYKVSAHFVIDRDGTIFQTVPENLNKLFVGWHCGKSKWSSNGKSWKNLNNIAIGIELINYNGNIFNYSKSQYDSLIELLFNLGKIYPKLTNAKNILGHEHIAGFRGKIDPGLKFNWEIIWDNLYNKSKLPKTNPERTAVIRYLKNKGIKIDLNKFLPINQSNSAKINQLMEFEVKKIFQNLN